MVHQTEDVQGLVRRPPAPEARTAEAAGSDTTSPKRPRRPRISRPTLAGLGFIAPLAVYMVLFYLYPLVENVSMSLHRFTRATYVTGEAPFVGTDIYREVIGSATFAPTIVQTGLFVVISLVFQYTIGLTLAVFFQRHFPLSGVLRGLFLVPWLLPIIVSGTTWQWMMDADSGVINGLLGVIGIDSVWWLNADNALWAVIIANIWLGIPFNLVILYSGLQNIPTDLYEAASVDGASPWRQFWSITFPLLRPVTAITLLLGFVYTLKVVDIIWIMTTGSGSSQTLATWAYSMAFGKGSSAIIRYSEASVVGTVLLLIAVAMGFVYLAVQRRQEA
ncbi:carbohydrate ABC transporter permease [Nocardioides bruguierae]|uniref:Sugar ABC transporter permease n=1 Tax=Nocardioides bruguierae TaxID=2945102 RepID=A0A9X2D8P3_9ACTN|nr:sugar ABC transporter permease [Nocardioides bruguierae]MCL8026920.1 sugar ABC transporter permease [Nocardioides bruguierae]MCM0621375.1 sugar ABC transporter permease [Nocardioides bruguierae]